MNMHNMSPLKRLLKILHFPFSGAVDEFFDDSEASCSRSEK
jgi:hypothetical protein